MTLWLKCRCDGMEFLGSNTLTSSQNPLFTTTKNSLIYLDMNTPLHLVMFKALALVSTCRAANPLISVVWPFIYQFIYLFCSDGAERGFSLRVYMLHHVLYSCAQVSRCNIGIQILSLLVIIISRHHVSCSSIELARARAHVKRGRSI